MSLMDVRIEDYIFRDNSIFHFGIVCALIECEQNGTYHGIRIMIKNRQCRLWIDIKCIMQWLL